MSEPGATSPQEYVRRALEAAEIADGCLDGRIRESFFSLAELRLQQAERAAGDEDASPDD